MEYERNGKYKDLLMDTGAEELAHIEMLATMIARLLEGAPATPDGVINYVSPAIYTILGYRPEQLIGYVRY